MSEVFGCTYASAYDALYHDKDYSVECDLLERIFKEYGDGNIKTILDLGCGTGNHAIPLAERGYEVIGIDISPKMLESARAKIASKNLPISFVEGDIKKLDLNRNRKFDAVIMMFAVLGYQSEIEDVIEALKIAHNHLRPGGLLAMDFWYGPAVLSQRPEQRIKVILTNKGKILRAVSSELDTMQQTCNVHYDLWEIDDNKLTAETSENHIMRFFFAKEIELVIKKIVGFKDLSIRKFKDLNESPDEGSWNVMAIAIK
jgi:SAM-dependent methyltransferase